MLDRDSAFKDGVAVGFARLHSKQEDNRKHRNNTNEIIGVSNEESERWKKKTMHARCGIGALTVVCTVLIVVLLLTLELGLNCKKHNITSLNQKTSLKDAVKFLLFSDFHFDYFYDDSTAPSPTNCRKLGNYSKASYKAPYGRVNCDSPAALIDSMLKATKEVSQDYNFVLMTGDLSAHKMDRPYFTNLTTPMRVLHNINVSANQIKEAFPTIPIFPLLGNNDLPGHYVLPVNKQWYIDTLAIFAPLILCNGCPEELPKPTSLDVLKKTYLDGGYYSVNITGKNWQMVLIVLNSVYWDKVASTGNPIIQAVARRQMSWLQDQLRQAKQKNQKVFVAGHIPPGINYHDGLSFWMGNYTHTYVQLVTGDYKDVVTGQFYAHIHRDDFHLQTEETQLIIKPKASLPPTNKSFAILSPSISPIYSNNPAFRVVYIDAEEPALLDYDQHYMDLVMATEFNAAIWQFDYRFSQHYPSTNPYINADRIYELNQGLLNATSDKTWLNYVFSRTVKYQPGSYSRFHLYCAMRYVFDKDYKKCISEFNVPGG